MADETLLDGGDGHRAKRTPAKRKTWNKARRTAFLKTLAETCNVTVATKRAGMGHVSVYAVRHRDPAFARLWDEALAIGYDRLETILLQRALEGVNDIDVAALVDADDAADGDGGSVGDVEPGKTQRGHAIPGSGVARRMTHTDVQVALAVLNRRGAKDGLRPKGRKTMGSDEVDALLTVKLDALARRRRPA